jgi:hypothetical protein
MGEMMTEEKRKPDITLRVWFSNIGLEAEVVDENGSRTIVRDFTWHYEVDDLVVMMRSWMYTLATLFSRSL